MSSAETSGEAAAASPPVKPGEFRLEVVALPASDVDRAKDFYTGLGWRLDADVAPNEGYRIVQLTPPGSACSIQFGTGVSSATPGSLQSLYLAVVDIAAAHEQLIARGARR
jgi:catechol 2,3-dioxygenase-like lactoylglutathione lyase family enzyme